MELFERKEYKYYVDIKHLESLRKRFLNNMVHDPFCQDLAENAYTVRSVYFDTRGLLFYYEKKDGLKIRKKLRIRVYGDPSPEGIAFLEIKRKYDNTVLKERSKIWLAEAPNLLNGAYLQTINKEPERKEKLALDRFIYLTKRLRLEPTTLITYEREALLGLDESNVRVTFDMNVRSHPQSNEFDIFQERDLKTLKNTLFILEIKFLGRMPIWIRRIIQEFKLRMQPISKYCNGLDAWRPNKISLDTPV
ncbi:MAG: polyphosphate polymerase domain-containing protein [Candidatus Hatepunaea meridiana]|nr:polyphosphate polymerase domain-containing protein [Candidatus Hatepunaea meridiana]